MNLRALDIARCCHEANRAYCIAIGDYSQPRWEDAPYWQQSSAITGVEYRLNHPHATPRQMHESWMWEKEKDGWKFGAVKDPTKKTHPCMVPYDKLPREQQVKDKLFSAVFDALTVIE